MGLFASYLVYLGVRICYHDREQRLDFGHIVFDMVGMASACYHCCPVSVILVSLKARLPSQQQLREIIILGGRPQCRVILPQFAQITAVPQPPSAMVMAFCLLIYEGLLKSPK